MGFDMKNLGLKRLKPLDQGPSTSSNQVGSHMCLLPLHMLYAALLDETT